jgi:hypothetical protein
MSASGIAAMLPLVLPAALPLGEPLIDGCPLVPLAPDAALSPDSARPLFEPLPLPATAASGLYEMSWIPASTSQPAANPAAGSRNASHRLKLVTLCAPPRAHRCVLGDLHGAV